MMSAMRARAVSAIKASLALKPAGTRAMSSGLTYAEEVAEMNKWRMISIPAGAVCISWCMWEFFGTHHHEEEHGEHKAYPHLRIRSKKFPWGDGDTTLFDFSKKDH